MASGSIRVDVAAIASPKYRGTTCHVCIANPDHRSILPATVHQPEQQQQEENPSTSPATFKSCLLCSNDYCARHESEQEGVCDSNHVSLLMKKLAKGGEEGQHHHEAGGSSTSVERKVRVFRSLEQRPERT